LDAKAGTAAMNYELALASLVVIVLHYLGIGRVSVGAVMWATFCVFIGYLAGALRVIHVVFPP
jgi:F0F1-type ATP synthase membrane subunit a